MKKYLGTLLFIFGLLVGNLTFFSSTASASFNPNKIMDDSVFNSSGAMSASQIDTFLNGLTSSCISSSNGFTTPNPTGYNPADGFIFGSNVSAGTAIYNAARAYDENPRVLLATLQKEQSIPTGAAGCYNEPNPNWPASNTPKNGTTFNCTINNKSQKCTYACTHGGGCMTIAVGYDCPGYCAASSEGFSKQIIRAAWKLKFNQQRSLGNYSWNIQKPGATKQTTWDNSDDPLTMYNGPMTKGHLQRCATCTARDYDGYYTTLDGYSNFMGSGATAALYYYTPFRSGNSNFVTIYEDWFGATTGPCEATGNVTGASGRQIIPNQWPLNGAATLTFVRLNNTASECVEAHSWNGGFHTWASHIPTNLKSLLPSANMKLVTGNMRSDRRDELMLVKLSSGNGHAEVHMWDNSYKNWVLRTATNLSNIDSAHGNIIAGDMNGDGRDELLYLRYSGSGGRLEVHTFSPDFHSWAGHALTSLSNFDPANGKIITGDMNGDGRDELMFLKYNGSGGRTEVHTWDSSYHKWAGHALTSLSNFDPASGEIITGDMNGDGRDELIYVKYQSGSGNVEVHIWNPDYHSWAAHYATNLSAFDPAD